MIIVPKWDKRNYGRKLISNFTKYWIRLTGWIIIRPKIALAVKIRHHESQRQNERLWTLPKRKKVELWDSCFFAQSRRIYSSDHNLVWDWSYGFLWNFDRNVILIWDHNSHDLTGQKNGSWIAGQLLLCLKPFVVLLNLFKDWIWEIVLLRSYYWTIRDC